MKEATTGRSSRKLNSKKYVRGLGEGAPLALAIPTEHTQGTDTEGTAGEDEPQPAQSGFLALQPADAEDRSPGRLHSIAVSNAPGAGAPAALEEGALADRVKRVLEDSALPKSVHDFKFALHHFSDRPSGTQIALAGVRHDPMLYSYLLDPTYSSHSLPEVALRRFNLKLSGNLAEAADVTGRLAARFARKSTTSG